MSRGHATSPVYASDPAPQRNSASALHMYDVPVPQRRRVPYNSVHPPALVLRIRAVHLEKPGRVYVSESDWLPAGHRVRSLPHRS